MKIASKVLAAGLMSAAVPLLVASAAAAPVFSSPALRDAAAPAAQTVQYRRGARGGQVGGFRGGRATGFRGGGGFHGGYRNGGIGPAIGLGVAGAVVGGALLGATQPYGYQSYGYQQPYGYQSYGYQPYGYRSYGYQEGLVEAPVAGGGDDAYCIQRFRSYDPSSGTYLGNDGMRHSCP